VTRVIRHEAVLDFFQDVFETPELSINIVIADIHCDSRHNGRGRWSPISNGSTKPPVRGGKVTKVQRPGRNRHGKKEG
jgi:hypothetical protein